MVLHHAAHMVEGGVTMSIKILRTLVSKDLDSIMLRYTRRRRSSTSTSRNSSYNPNKCNSRMNRYMVVSITVRIMITDIWFLCWLMILMFFYWVIHYDMMIVKMICHVGNWYDDVDDDIKIDVTIVIIKYCTTCI